MADLCHGDCNVHCKAIAGTPTGVTDLWCRQCGQEQFCKNSQVMTKLCSGACESGFTPGPEPEPEPTSAPPGPAPHPDPPAPGPAPTPAPTPPTPQPEQPVTTAAPPAGETLVCSGGANSCKSKCQALCSLNLATNQCWGTPRYVECKCKDGARHFVPGCECMRGSECPVNPNPGPAPTVAPTLAPTVAPTLAPTLAPQPTQPGNADR